jgi:hypothetical protein
VAGSPGSGFAGPRAGSEPGLVVIEAEFGDKGLARVLEPAEIGGPRLAVFVIGVDGEGVARPVGDGGDRAALVGDQPAPVGEARALVPDDRLVGARARHRRTDPLGRAKHARACSPEPTLSWFSPLTVEAPAGLGPVQT